MGIVRQVPGQVGRGLDGIGVEEDAAGTRQGTDFEEWLHGADLVVGGHDADQHGVWTDRRGNRLRIHAAERIYADDGQAAAKAVRQLLRRFQDSRVFDGAGDDVAPAGGVERRRAGPGCRFPSRSR